MTRISAHPIARACLAAALLVLPPASIGAGKTAPGADEVRAAADDRLDSKRLEGELQRLSWDQFRSVIEAIPKLKADVDAYGPAGWTYVKGRYRTHEWRKNIDKLDGDERRRLAALIAAARKKP